MFSAILQKARAEKCWALALLATALLPWMLIFSRAGGEICFALTGLLFLGVSARTQYWRWLRDPFIVIAFVACAWMALVAVPLGVEPGEPLKALAWIRFPLFYAALRYWVLTLPAARTMLGAMLVLVLSLVALDACMQVLTGTSLTGHERLVTGRLTGPFGKPKVGIYLSKLLLPAFGLILTYALATKNRVLAWTSLAWLIGMLGVLLLTGERAALLSTLLGCGVIGSLAMVSDRRSIKYCVGLGAVVVTVLAFLYLGSDAVHARTGETLDVLGNYLASTYGLLAQAAFDMGMQHPLHGIGLENFEKLCPELPYQGVTFRGMHPHNYYMEWFAETGAPGLLLFIGMVGALIWNAFVRLRETHGIERGMAIVALGFCAQQFFPLMGTQSFFSNWPAMVLFYPLAVTFAALPPSRSKLH